MNALVTISPALPVELTDALELAADFARASKAKATQQAYASDFKIFELWCGARGLDALAPTPAALCVPGRRGTARPPALDHFAQTRRHKGSARARGTSLR
jgi:hypothetical protein